jgi:uncharacterized protein YbjT (DUF2867 family)
VPDTVLVTGGTGTLGRQVVPRLQKSGLRTRVMGRVGGDVRANLATGAGLEAAVAGCDTVVHLATGVRGFYGAIKAVDVLGTQRLLEQATMSGVRHVVYISIVGVDRLPFAYYRAKLEAERMLQQQATVAWTILRATQFHDLVDLYFRAMQWLPVLPIPKNTPWQPVDAGEVADRLCDAVVKGPRCRLPDMGGPQVLNADELARAWLAAKGIRRPLLQLTLPGSVAAGFRAGYHTVPDRRDGRITWQDWLVSRRDPRLHSTARSRGCPD